MIRLRHMFCLAASFTLAGCQKPGQNTYDYSEVGKSHLTQFGTIVGAREINIIGHNSGAGELAGGAIGGMAAYNGIGNGNGQLAAAAAGIIIGAAGGYFAEQAMQDQKGIEYTVIRENGKTSTIAQTMKPDERIFKKGDRVMIQITGSYQRVLPTDDTPTEIARPKGIKFTDAPSKKPHRHNDDDDPQQENPNDGSY